MKTNEIALILAGGRGKRMDTLCYLRPKPLLPFAGKFRVIDFTLNNCIQSRISDIAVLVDYQRGSLMEYLKEWQPAHSKVANLHILPPKGACYAATADAVYQNHDYLEQRDNDIVIVLAGDHVYKMDYRKMIEFHHKMKADVTVGVARVPLEETHRFGTVTVDGSGRIKEFKEKTSASQTNIVSMGIYVFSKDLLLRRLYEDTDEQNSLHDFGYNIIPRMVQTDRAFAYEFKGYWYDIGTIETYYNTNLELLRPDSHFTRDKTLPVLEKSNVLKGSENKGGVIVNSMVSPGCIVKGHVENSILSPGVQVEQHTIVKNSVIMADAFIGGHSIVDGCIIDENVYIGQFCYVGLGNRLSIQDLKVTVLGKDVIVPDYTTIGCQCNVKPGLGPEEFSTHLIPSGTTLVSTHLQ
jgi:glucose-1-phosphate adenylyltransferase